MNVGKIDDAKYTTCTAISQEKSVWYYYIFWHCCILRKQMGVTCLGSTLTLLKLTVIIDDSYLCLSNAHYGVRGIERGVVDSHVNCSIRFHQIILRDCHVMTN